MKAAFCEFNKLSPDMRKAVKVVSMDVKALYPSMKWNGIVEAVRTMVENSKLKVDNVNRKELARYLAIVMTQREVYLEGLQHVIPKRRKRSARKVTIRYLRIMSTGRNWLGI